MHVSSIEAIGNSKVQLKARGERAAARDERARKDVRTHTRHTRFCANEKRCNENYVYVEFQYRETSGRGLLAPEIPG